MKPFHAARDVVALAWRLFARTIGAKYRKSYLGYFWMVAPALLITGGVTLARGAGILAPGQTGLPYPLFALIGVLMWQLFADAFEVPHRSFEGARSYLTRVNFSREAIVLAQLFESLVTGGVRLLLVLVLVWFVVAPGPGAMAIIACCFAASLVLGLGVGALLMPFTLLFEDLHHVLKLVLAYGMFLTPALYQPHSGLFAKVVALNPVSPLMRAARDAAAGGALTEPTAAAVVAAAAVLAAALGLLMVRATAPIVIERMLLGGK